MIAPHVNSKIAEVPVDDGMPELVNWRDLRSKQMKEPSHAISDCVRIGQLMAITGSSKTHKSFTLAELTHAVATGGKFFGKQCLKGKVFAIDFELGEYSFRDRLIVIEEQTGVEMG